MFNLLITLIIIQRFLELVIAKRNEISMKQRGGIEVGKEHYKYIVAVHILFFVTLIGEVMILQKEPTPFWPHLIILFLLTQLGRIWVISSLGTFWNTKIIILPKEKVIAKGPYRFLKHPNYLIVSLEFIIIPLLFQAYVTLFLFSLLNMLVLSIRIPFEEKALSELTEYEKTFSTHKRLFPIKTKRI